MLNYLLYLIVAIFYWIILLMPVSGPLIWAQNIRVLLWQSGPIYPLVFHIILGMILYFTLSITLMKKLILISIIPLIGFLLTLIVIYITGNFVEEPEGVGYGLIAVLIAMVSLSIGTLAGFLSAKFIPIKL